MRNVLAVIVQTQSPTRVVGWQGTREIWQKQEWEFNVDDEEQTLNAWDTIGEKKAQSS